MPGPSGQTSRLQLPYPVPDDSVDVPRDVKALADKLDPLAATVIPVVGALPANPADGQECYYRFMPTTVGQEIGPNIPAVVTPVFWHLRWDAAVSRWYALGGTPIEVFAWNEVFVSQPTYPPVWGQWNQMYRVMDNAPNPMEIALPAAGMYEVRIGGGRGSIDQDAEAYCTYLVSPTEGDYGNAPVSGAPPIYRAIAFWRSAQIAGPSTVSQVVVGTGQRIKWVGAAGYGILRIMERRMRVAPIYLTP